MPTRRTYQVKDVAELSGLSIRALHHYDEIGLLKPSARTAAGYRLYNDDDLLRLQQILIGRELGLPLEAIRRSLDDPTFDRRAALLAQRAELTRRAAATADMIRAIDTALNALDAKNAEEPNVDFKKIFNGFDPGKYDDEVKQRWGGSAAYEATKRRTKRYTEQDWIRLRDEQAGIYADMAAAMRAGKAPDDAAAMDVAERHRLSIDRWFYPCSSEMHCGLAALYEADDRFRESIDKAAEGLTPFLAAAIRANAARGKV